jgi:hypothetical protein
MASGGFVSRVRTITASIWASSIVRGVPDRGSSQRPSSRSSAPRHPVRSRVVPALANVLGKMPGGVDAVVVILNFPIDVDALIREMRALHPLLPFVLATRASSKKLDALLKGEERIDAEGAGALILLRGHYFITGSLSKTDAECAKVCRLGARKFARIRSWLFSCFDDEGRSAELDASIEETERIISNRREAGHKGGVGKALNEELQEEEHLKSSSTKPSPPPSSEPRAREGDEIATEALAVLPISVRANPGWRGLGAWIARLLSDGVDRADIVVGIAQCLRSLKGQPPNTFGYFSAAIERAREARTRPLSRAAPLPLPDQPHQLDLPEIA